MSNGIPCEECYEQPASGDTAGVRALCSGQPAIRARLFGATSRAWQICLRQTFPPSAPVATVSCPQRPTRPPAKTGPPGKTM
jgi:hypothetical protein